MADRWTSERDRDWRDRGSRYQDWRDRDARRAEGWARGQEDRSWRDDDYSSRMGVTSGGAVYQTGRGYGQDRTSGQQRFANQDYTGRQGGERERGDYGGGGRTYASGQGYRRDQASSTSPRAPYRPERSQWDETGASAYEFERSRRRAWDLDDDRRMARDDEREEGRYGRDYREPLSYRAERRDQDRDDDRARHGEGPGDFLQRAGERISNWFRGDHPMHGGREDSDEGRYYRSDFGREARPLHRGFGPKGYQRSDDRISDEVHQRLTDDPWIDASEIDVEVKSGEVTLSGHVDNREAKHRAERLIEDLSGVRHVQNNLRVNPDARLTSAGRGYGSSVLEAQMRRNEQASDPGNNGASGLSGRTSTGAAAERSTTDTPTGQKRS